MMCKMFCHFLLWFFFSLTGSMEAMFKHQYSADLYTTING